MLFNSNFENEKPIILDTIEQDDGSRILDITNKRACDIFETIHFHQPDEAQYSRTIERFMDRFIELELLTNMSIKIPNDFASEDFEINSDEENLRVDFKKGITPKAVNDILLVASNYDQATANARKIKVLEEILNSGLIPPQRIVFDTNNEITGASRAEEEIEIEILTARYKRGDYLGGPRES